MKLRARTLPPDAINFSPLKSFKKGVNSSFVKPELPQFFLPGKKQMFDEGETELFNKERLGVS